ncbi:MAG: DUF2158 domain-containing protein [Saprospiraceae bacterium]|nr:DUF2158 domain-containing protein [Saprospiraceae bacterium]
MQTFTIGEVVHLKSGGPKMTVENIAHGKVFCQWFDENNNVQRAMFTPESLEKVKD